MEKNLYRDSKGMRTGFLPLGLPGSTDTRSFNFVKPDFVLVSPVIVLGHLLTNFNTTIRFPAPTSSPLLAADS